MTRAPSSTAIAAIAECCAVLRVPRPSCHDWLRARLSAGPASILATWEAGIAAGFDDHDLNHAARRLNVSVVGGDTWRLQ
ncbi:hypothetical protein [Lysobacter sp. HA18]